MTLRKMLLLQTSNKKYFFIPVRKKTQNLTVLTTFQSVTLGLSTFALWCNFHHLPSTGFLIFLNLNAAATKHGEGNGTPLQYSCLENPTDGGAW